MIQAHGLTQKDAAAAIGKTPQMMSHFLGQTDPPLDFVREIYASLHEPLYKEIMSKEEIAAISGVNPVIAPIGDDLAHALYAPRGVQGPAFRGVDRFPSKGHSIILFI